MSLIRLGEKRDRLRNLTALSILAVLASNNIMEFVNNAIANRYTSFALFAILMVYFRKSDYLNKLAGG